MTNIQDLQRFSQNIYKRVSARKNLLINGNFDIWQRGTSQTSSGYGSDDRWANLHLGSTKTHSIQYFTLGQTDVPGNPRFFSRTVVSSVAGANNYVVKSQSIENVLLSSGQTMTLSFWAKADATRYMAVDFYQAFGTGGSTFMTVQGDVKKVQLTTSWQKFVITVNFPSVAGKTIVYDNDDHKFTVQFWFDAGSNWNSRTDSLGQQSGTFDISQVQFEYGPVASDFEERPTGFELELCQRYFQICTVGAVIRVTTSGSYGGGYFYQTWPARMRKSATASIIADDSNLTPNMVTLNGTGTLSSNFNISATETGYLVWNNTALVNVGEYFSWSYVIGSAEL